MRTRSAADTIVNGVGAGEVSMSGAGDLAEALTGRFENHVASCPASILTRGLRDKQQRRCGACCDISRDTSDEQVPETAELRESKNKDIRRRIECLMNDSFGSLFRAVGAHGHAACLYSPVTELRDRRPDRRPRFGIVVEPDPRIKNGVQLIAMQNEHVRTAELSKITSDLDRLVGGAGIYSEQYMPGHRLVS
jgi:hypothetical protein